MPCLFISAPLCDMKVACGALLDDLLAWAADEDILLPGVVLCDNHQLMH